MEKRTIFSVKEVSKYLNVSESCIRKAIREHKLPYFKVMSKILFDKEQIDKYIMNESEKMQAYKNEFVSCVH